MWTPQANHCGHAKNMLVFLFHIIGRAAIFCTCPPQCGTRRERSAVRLGLFRGPFALVYPPRVREMASQRPDVAHVCPSACAALCTCFCMAHNLRKLADRVKARRNPKEGVTTFGNWVSAVAYVTVKAKLLNTSRLLRSVSPGA